MKTLIAGLVLIAAFYTALVIYWSPRAIIKRSRARGVYTPTQAWEKGVVPL